MTIKEIWHPDPKVLRARERARARDGAVIDKGCPHPMSSMEQFMDYESDKDRNGRPTNLFQCGICHHLLWLSDANGREASEG